ncbi:Tim10 DDP zinc finger domain-containing [Cryptosporidium sp. chipmunk genotype I]|uniref:Tim10 DDP zinc finger domain-containing n=1 Tax=Cryptosporidium sp. chipmunk genotype I TaxID=1280935 RepID=UPI00351AA28A|nr:Tim10 DDP zinc finger domain-containing [Cryptosporidium sp. chipmunk genotype I]
MNQSLGQKIEGLKLRRKRQIMEGDKENSSIQAIEKLQLLQRVVESQKMIAKLTSRCYKKCAVGGSGGGGKSLTKKEKLCLWNCAQNFLESSEFITSRITMTEDTSSSNKKDSEKTQN